jgi:hypothetical protein
MFKSSTKRCALTVAAVTAAVALGASGSAYGQATPTRFSNPPEPFTEEFGPADDPCFGSGGVISGTDTVSGTVFQIEQGFHVLLHTVSDSTVRFNDPALPVYSGHAIDNLTFEVQTTPGSDNVVLTDHTTDRATAPDGSTILVQETRHVSALDVEPPGPFPGDVVHVSIDHLRITCPPS